MSRTPEQADALLRALRRVVHTDRIMTIEQARAFCAVVELDDADLDETRDAGK